MKTKLQSECVEQLYKILRLINNAEGMLPNMSTNTSNAFSVAKKNLFEIMQELLLITFLDKKEIEEKINGTKNRSL